MRTRDEIIEKVYEDRLSQIFMDFFTGSTDNWDRAMAKLARSLAQAQKAYDALLAQGIALQLIFTEKKMSGPVKLLVKPQNLAKRKGVQDPVKWSTLSAGLAIQLVYEDLSPVPGVDPSTVTVDMSIDDPAKCTLTPGDDSFHWKMTRSPAATGRFLVNCVFTFNDGHVGPFTAVQPVDLDTVNPTDVVIVISGN